MSSYSKGQKVGISPYEATRIRKDAADIVKNPSGGFDIVHDTTRKVLSHHKNRPDAEIEQIKVHKRNSVPVSQEDEKRLENEKKKND